MLESMKKRRSVYNLNKGIEISEEKIIEIVENATKLVPDAFDMKSQRVVIVLGKKHDELWNKIYDVFNGKVSKEKIESFKAAYGTVLYFIDEDVVDSLQKQFESYAENFPIWANQSNGMLQYAVWTAFAEHNIGANIQHYNPVIDEAVKEMFNINKNYKLIAQMPFGGIEQRPDEKQSEDIEKRVKIVK